MLDPLILEKVLHGVVLEFGAIVSSYCLDFSTMLTLSLLGEDDESLVGLILRLKEENPTIS